VAKRKNIKNQYDHNRYLISYSDLITLLLGFFVILYATTKIDSANYEKLQKALQQAFNGGAKSVLEGGDGLLDGSKGILPEPSFPNSRGGNIDSIENEIEKGLLSYFKSSDVTMVREGDAIKIDMPEELLFNSGYADIKPKGLKFVDYLADILSDVPNQITIDGHTDNVPISNERFKSNWHLSVARAMNVAYSMMQNGLNKNNVAVRGYGEQRPKESNASDSGRAKNRRVELIISKVDVKSPSKIGYVKDSIN
jgi:chemotaxis protein MotB